MRNHEINVTTLPCYVQVESGKIADTVELVPGSILADYDKDGKLIGVEIISREGKQSKDTRLFQLEERVRNLEAIHGLKILRRENDEGHNP